MCRNLRLSAILIIIVFFSSTSALKFTFSLKAGAKTCFSEVLSIPTFNAAESTPFHFRIEGPDDQYDISLNHRDGTPLVVNKRADKIKKIDSYASVTGEYYLCAINKDSAEKKVTFNFFQGLEVSDSNPAFGPERAAQTGRQQDHR
jgi:hypothetical protein